MSTSGGILGQASQERFFDQAGVHSIQVFREHHDARDAVEFTIYFKTQDGKKHRTDIWVKNSELVQMDNTQAQNYCEDLAIKAVKNALDTL